MPTQKKSTGARKASKVDRSLSPAPESNGRRDSNASNSSVDSRAVVEEIEADNATELVELIEDVDSFINREGGTGDIPKYIARKHIIKEFGKALESKDKKVPPERKVKVIELSTKLVEKAKSKEEHDQCLRLILKAVLSQLASNEREVHNSSIRFLQHHEKEEKNRPLIVRSLAEDGIGHKKYTVCVETAKLIPGIFMPYLDQTDILPAMIKLHEQLSTRDRETYCFGALLRCQEVFGKEKFDRLEKKVPERHQKLFKSMTQNYEDKDYHISKKRPPDGISFGFIHNQIINRVTDKTDRHVRADGALTMKKLLEDHKEDLGLLLPYMASFVKFLGGLNEDMFTKVVLTSLECLNILLENAPVTMKQHSEITVFILIKVSLKSCTQVKSELYRSMKALMKCFGVMHVVEMLVLEIHHKNSLLREDIITYLIYALIVFPSSEFDLAFICERIVPYIHDDKCRVRHAALELAAVLHSHLGAKGDILLKFVEKAQRDLPTENMVPAVNARIARKALPKITEQNYIEYRLVIPAPTYQTYYAYYAKTIPNADSFRKQSEIMGGSDIAWIMLGNGGLSRGTSNFFATHLVVKQGIGYKALSIRRGGGGGGSTKGNTDTDSQSSSASSLNKHSKVPDINQVDMDEDEDHNGYMPTGYDEGENGELESIDRDEDILKHWHDNPRELSDEEKTVHQEGYKAKAKTASKEELKYAKEDISDYTKKMDKKGSNEKYHKESLASLKLANSTFETFFEAYAKEYGFLPGAFIDPVKAYSVAITDLSSRQWEIEFDGLEAIYRLVLYHPMIVIDHITDLEERLSHECRNLRCQVARAAIQSYCHLFVHLGRIMEQCDIENIAGILFTKAAAIDSYIRSDANDALSALVERLSVYRVADIIANLGVPHKNVRARLTAAMLLDSFVTTLGSQVMEDTKLRTTVITAGVKLLVDPETRKVAQNMFAVLLEHPKAMSIIEQTAGKDNDWKTAKKHLEGSKQKKKSVKNS